METFGIKALQLIAALALLVIIHEFGHYILARAFGIKVEKFYLFFDWKFALKRWKPKPSKKVKLDKDGSPKASWRDTEYGIGWLPLGGYVKIAGMIDESMDKDQMAKDPQPWEFRTKPAYQRLLVMLGGVIMNLILAIIIYIVIAFVWGEKTIEYRDVSAGFDYVPAAQEAGFRNGDIPLKADGKEVSSLEPLMKIASAKEVDVLRNGKDTVNLKLPDDFIFQVSDAGGFMSMRIPVIIKQIIPGEPAAKAGLMEGDRFIAVDSVPTPSYSEFSKALVDNAGKPTEFTIERDNRTLTVTATPTEDGKLGFGLASPIEIYPVKVIDYNILTAIPKGISNGKETFTNYVGSLKYVFTKRGAESLGGFGSIGAMFPAKWNWLSFWETVAFLSIILAFMNVIPIPALDGGHVMFLLWEVITGRKASDKVLEYAQMAGMLFLLALLLYANGNDVYRFFIK